MVLRVQNASAYGVGAKKELLCGAYPNDPRSTYASYGETTQREQKSYSLNVLLSLHFDESFPAYQLRLTISYIVYRLNT
jgi:hypothetical protein